MKNTKFLQEIYRPHWIILYLYLGMILVYACFYYFNKESFSNLDTFGESIYFSIVTITTLGYGDILPLDDVGMFMVSIESISGVIILGFFLISVSSEIVKEKERKRIDTHKLSFKEQYKIWRENTIRSLLFVSKSTLSSQEEKELNDKDKFRDYFNANESQNWYDIANNLSYDKFYTKEILHELEFLQRNIETLIMQVPIGNIDSLNRLNRYINGLHKMRQYDLNEHDEIKMFMRTLWELITLWDWSTGSYDKNYLLETVDSL